jgi:hypothetical protein
MSLLVRIVGQATIVVVQRLEQSKRVPAADHDRGGVLHGSELAARIGELVQRIDLEPERRETLAHAP